MSKEILQKKINNRLIKSNNSNKLNNNNKINKNLYSHKIKSNLTNSQIIMRGILIFN